VRGYGVGRLSRRGSGGKTVANNIGGIGVGIYCRPICTSPTYIVFRYRGSLLFKKNIKSAIISGVLGAISLPLLGLVLTDGFRVEILPASAAYGVLFGWGWVFLGKIKVNQKNLQPVPLKKKNADLPSISKR